MSRKRKRKNADLPDNLYVNIKNGVDNFIWENPLTLKRKAIGTDRKDAIKKAILLNEAMREMGVTERTKRVSSNTVAQLVSKFEAERLADLRSANSKRDSRNRLRRISEGLGKLGVMQVTTKILFEWLEKMPTHSYIKLRTELIILFDYALQCGARTDNENPAARLKKKAEPKRQRERLTREMFDRIHAAASPELQITMDLMLATSLRPSDIVQLRFDQFNNGSLFVITQKTNTLVEYHFSAALEEKTVRRARRSGILSPYIVHRLPKRLRRSKQKDHHTQLTADEISDQFRDLRDSLGLGGELPPSLYECRSLAALEAQQRGRTPAEISRLLAHTDEATRAVYLWDHEVFDGRAISGRYRVEVG